MVLSHMTPAVGLRAHEIIADVGFEPRPERDVSPLALHLLCYPKLANFLNSVVTCVS